MIKLSRKQVVSEAKQGGTLYHVCNSNAMAKYIAPKDTLSSSGQYTNYMKNSTEYVSFTRSKYFIPYTKNTEHQFFFFQIVVDGNKLSNNYTITPYNDFYFTDKVGGKNEFEEVVKGPIKHLHSYILNIFFTFSFRPIFTRWGSDDTISFLNDIKRDLLSCITYLNKFNCSYKPIIKAFDDDNKLFLNTPITSIQQYINAIDSLLSIISFNPDKQSFKDAIATYLSIFNKDLFSVKQFILDNLSFNQVIELLPKDVFYPLFQKEYNTTNISNDSLPSLVLKYNIPLKDRTKILLYNILKATPYTYKDGLPNIENMSDKDIINLCIKLDSDPVFPLHNNLSLMVFNEYIPILTRAIFDHTKVEDIKELDPFRTLKGDKLLTTLDKYGINTDNLIDNLIDNRS